ncbi:MAG: tripartite tricarboxylate transporter substrate binding protein, partial [Solimonas sp.]
MTLRRRTLIAASAAASLASPALAQNFPRRGLQLIVAFPAGGSTDVGARILAAAAEKSLGQQITVVNKAGAGGQLGFTEIARARPDGYTLGFLNLPGMNTIVLDPERKAAFGIDSFIPIVNQVLDPGIIWVKGDSPYKSLADLIDGAKKQPGKISACTTGILSDDHLAILMMQEAAKVEFRIVHFDGGAQQLTGVMGGHVDVAFDNVGGVAKRVQSGELRGLTVMDNERSKFVPNVPTTKELGYTTVISNSTRGVGAPKGTPPEVVKVIEAAFLK